MALAPAEQTSPLARWPYYLRHACLSTWLNGGVYPTQVAEWAFTHQARKVASGSAVSMRIPATTFQTQTQTVRGYPAPDQRRVLGRLRTCRAKC